MEDFDIESSKDKALIFFERGKEVASTDNFDYAINLYLEGIKRAPDSLEDGHSPLRQISLLRQSRGGKPANMVERLKVSRGKTPLEHLINAEYLLAKDPDNLTHAQAMLNACVAGGYLRTADWIGRIIFSACKSVEKPSFHILENLKDRFVDMSMYKEAVACCAMILKQKPEDHHWQSEYKNLAASATIKQGRYDKSEAFSQSVDDNEAQHLIRKKESLMKDSEFRKVLLEQADSKYRKAPDVYANRIEYAQKLADIGDPKLTKKACELLVEWFDSSDDFGYKKLHNDIVIRQLRDRVRLIRTDVETRGSSDELSRKMRDAVNALSNFEIEHFVDCIKNYPTDLKYRYELGVRLMHKKAYDKAIPLFQQASKSPGFKIKALNLLGMCFFNKGWYPDAIDVFEAAIKSHINEDEVYKELRYNLARACELDHRTERALTIYRKLAQLDYSYRDVAARVNKLRDV